MRNQAVKSSLCAVLPFLFLISGCATGPLSETQQLLLDLDRSYTIGAIVALLAITDANDTTGGPSLDC